MDNPELKIGLDGKTYQVVDNTWYHHDTPIEVIKILETCRTNRREYRLIIYYGDVNTGETWVDPKFCESESDIRAGGAVGYVGRSTGTQKIPLEICKSSSYGGQALLDNCIVKVQLARGKRVLYQHKNFHFKEE